MMNITLDLTEKEEELIHYTSLAMNMTESEFVESLLRLKMNEIIDGSVSKIVQDCFSEEEL